MQKLGELQAADAAKTRQVRHTYLRAYLRFLRTIPWRCSNGPVGWRGTHVSGGGGVAVRCSGSRARRAPESRYSRATRQAYIFLVG